jgi:hypothetical protein
MASAYNSLVGNGSGINDNKLKNEEKLSVRKRGERGKGNTYKSRRYHHHAAYLTFYLLPFLLFSVNYLSLICRRII